MGQLGDYYNRHLSIDYLMGNAGTGPALASTIEASLCIIQASLCIK
ncbi:MAG: hypothetical protein IBX61_09365 [Thermoleophilia bacterium]|nr:hypothetical protein [Thermoleophilia bacterium]